MCYKIWFRFGCSIAVLNNTWAFDGAWNTGMYMIFLQR